MSYRVMPSNTVRIVETLPSHVVQYMQQGVQCTVFLCSEFHFSAVDFCGMYYISWLLSDFVGKCNNIG